MIDGALDFAIGAVALAMLLTSWRLLRGPSPVDRVLALDTLYINTVALVDPAGPAAGAATCCSRPRW